MAEALLCRDMGRGVAGVREETEFHNARYAVENDNEDSFVTDPAGFDWAEPDWHVERTVLPLRQRLEARGERLVVNLCYVGFGDHRTPHMAP